MVIKNWHYDSGDPHFMAAIDKWSNSRLPCWRCQIFKKDLGKSIEKWLEENSTTAEISFKFNSGNPCYFITIYDEEEATAFLMTWGT